MAKKKRASWVGAASPIDPETNLEKPLAKLKGEARDEALKDSESKKLVKPRKKRESAGPTGARPVARPATRVALEQAGVREATNPELRRGKTSAVVRNQAKPKQSAGPKLPRIGQIYKHSDGRMMRVSAENIAEVHEDAKRTVLPEAGRDVMTPAARPTPLPGPRGGLRPAANKNVSGNRAGLGVAHAVAKDHTDRAINHLETMAASEHGSGPYRQAQKSFKVVHGEMGRQNMSKKIHGMLQLAHNYIDTKQKNIPKMLNATKAAVNARLHEGKLAEEERAWRQMQNE